MKKFSHILMIVLMVCAMVATPVMADDGGGLAGKSLVKMEAVRVVFERVKDEGGRQKVEDVSDVAEVADVPDETEVVMTEEIDPVVGGDPEPYLPGKGTAPRVGIHCDGSGHCW